MRAEFPFAALVGQEPLMDALVWLAVEPAIGGLLVTGTRGTAKSTAVRALAALLPPIEPGVPTPFVELPIGATEDRVVGTLDVRTLLGSGERQFDPGLLARADRGVLYVDEVNLLPDHLVDVILDAAASGKNTVERDGASVVHDARIMLVGSMNPEEGELRPQLLDRFGLCVAIVNDDDLDRRVEIVERRLRFEHDPAAFALAFEARTSARRDQIARARALLPSVTIDRAHVRLAASLALEARVEGMRADLTIVRTARAIAACDGRTAVRADDIEAAAQPALAHRRRDVPRGAPPRPPSPPSPPRGDETTEQPSPAGTNGVHGGRRDAVEIGAAAHVEPRGGAVTPLAVRRTRRLVARGKSATPVLAGAARVVRRPTARIAPLPTIHAAAIERPPEDAAAPLVFETAHLRFIERRGRERELVILVVDASGSMAAAARMRAAKGVVCGLLEDAYRRRDAVALIAFRGEDAEVLVPPTRSAVLAYRRLRTLPTGGRTPLAAALRRAREVAQAYVRRESGTRVALVLVSDARANAPERDALGAALREAALTRDAVARALCVDTERGRVRLRNAQRIAASLDAQYRHLDDCSERALGATVREWMATA
jgi:magnesium chelatase subunit D